LTRIVGVRSVCPVASGTLRKGSCLPSGLLPESGPSLNRNGAVTVEKRLKGKRVLAIVAPVGFRDEELQQPRQILESEARRSK